MAKSARVQRPWIALRHPDRSPGRVALGAAMILGAAALAVSAQAEAPMEIAKARIAEHQKLPVFTAPGVAFDAKACIAGKKMMSIPLTMTNPYSVTTNNAMAAAAKDVGLPYSTWTNQLRVDQWIAGISDAVSEKDTLVNLWSGVNPDVLVPQIKAATAAGVKVVSTDTYDFTQTPNPALSAAALSDHSLAAQLLADIAFVDTDGKPNVLMIGSDEIKATRPMIKAMKDELAALCPTCAVEHLNVPAPEWATKIQAGVQAALIANPKINFILPVYDSMTQFVIPALRITNRMGAVKIASADGTPFVIDMVRNGQIAADVGSSLGWLGYAGLDAAMREMCGLPMVHRLNTPFFVFDQSNAATAGVPANYNDGYGNSHIAGFRKLWGLQ